MSSCTFCGHGDAPESIYDFLKDKIEQMILGGKANNFYVGNHGNFDHMALRILWTMKNKYPDIQYSVVLAYLPEKKDSFEMYQEGETLYPDGIEKSLYRFAITFRNKWMVEHSEYLISYVKGDLEEQQKL